MTTLSRNVGTVDKKQLMRQFNCSDEQWPILLICIIVAYFTMEIGPNLTKPTLKLNGGLAKLGFKK